jgi:hypothetical protein
MHFWNWLKSVFSKPKPIPNASHPASFVSAFPKDLHYYIFKKVANMPEAKDEKRFFKDGLTQENWVHLFAGMCNFESGFRPAHTYKEAFKNSRGEFVISTGLFQVSYESAAGYGFKGITTEQLKDPYKNIDVAVAIMRRLVTRDGIVASGTNNFNSLGGARYWSVLREPKIKEVIAFANKWAR